MGWIRVDDHFSEHPKLAQVGPVGWGFWLAGLAYCNRNLTDGFIPRAIAHSLATFELVDDDDSLLQVAVASGMSVSELDCQWVARFLVDAGAWHEVPGGYRIHDYSDYQPSREKVLSEREQRAARQQRWRDGQRNGESDASTPHAVDALVDGGVDALVQTDPTPTPSKRTSSLRSDVVECFAFWQERCGHPHAKLTAERRRKIEARRKEGYTVQQIREAIDGAARAAFVNDVGKRFDDIELICRNGSKLEDFIGRATAKGNVVPIQRPAALQRADAWLAHYPEEAS